MSANRYLRLSAQWSELGIEPQCSLAEVARELNLSHERARQLEVIALKKLKQALLARGYRLDDLIDVTRIPFHASSLE